ncbi:MAG: hypothetical protein KIT46_03495 [Anaerolineales bacterium]|nr:hypothetical protein [Anaerolineales bacterium]MCW5855090.1 hypothetical protein [Anaerolineales bacterium]
MSAKSDSRLKKALDYVRSHDAARARPLLVKILQAEPKNATAWYLLSHVLDDPERQQYALLQALQADPDFERARTRLKELRSASMLPKARVGAEEVAALSFEPGQPELSADDELRASVAPFIAGPDEMDGPVTQTDGRPAWLKLVLGLLLVALLGSILLLGWRYVGSELLQPGASPTPVASRTLVPTWTPTPAP